MSPPSTYKRLGTLGSPVTPLGPFQALMECLSRRVAAKIVPGLGRRAKMDDPWITPQSFEGKLIERTLGRRWIHKKMGALVPPQIQASPFSGQNHVQHVLIPPKHMLTVLAEAIQKLIHQSLKSPPLDTNYQQSTVEVLRVGRQIQFAEIGDRPRRSEIRTSVGVARQVRAQRLPARSHAAGCPKPLEGRAPARAQVL